MILQISLGPQQHKPPTGSGTRNTTNHWFNVRRGPFPVMYIHWLNIFGRICKATAIKEKYVQLCTNRVHPGALEQSETEIIQAQDVSLNCTSSTPVHSHNNQQFKNWKKTQKSEILHTEKDWKPFCITRKHNDAKSMLTSGWDHWTSTQTEKYPGIMSHKRAVGATSYSCVELVPRNPWWKSLHVKKTDSQFWVAWPICFLVHLGEKYRFLMGVVCLMSVTW